MKPANDIHELKAQLFKLYHDGVFGPDEIFLEAIEEFISLSEKSVVKSINITPSQKIMGRLFLSALEKHYETEP